MKKYHRIQIVLVAVQLMFAFLLMIGEKTFLRPCSARPDGTFMTCHWAGESVYVLSILLFFGAMLMLIIRKQEVYAALEGMVILICLLMKHIPGGFIPLCMKKDMRCWAVMRPGVGLLCDLVILLAIVVEILVWRTKKEAGSGDENRGEKQ